MTAWFLGVLLKINRVRVMNEHGTANNAYRRRNRPFVDGNKRTGAVASLVFPALNGVDIESDEEELEKLVLGVAEGKLSKAAAAEFFRQHSRQ